MQLLFVDSMMMEGISLDVLHVLHTFQFQSFANWVRVPAVDFEKWPSICLSFQASAEKGAIVSIHFEQSGLKE